MNTVTSQSGAQLRRQYLLSLIAIGVLLLIALFAYAWFSLDDRRSDIRAGIRAQSEQLKVSLDDKINLVRGHVFAMQRAIENTLARPDLSDSDLAERLQQTIGLQTDTLATDAVDASALTVDIGSLHVTPGTPIDKTFQRDLAAAVSFLWQAAGSYQWYGLFEWSYYYDAHEQWFLIYPGLSRAELLRITRAPNLTEAIATLFEADGTRPVDRLGPRNNPQRAMIWTPPYEDTGGKGRMVSLLAPIYLGDEYVGTIGTDVTLNTLSDVLRTHAPEAGRALVMDADGRVLADADGALPSAENDLTVAQLFPGADLDGPDWLKLPLPDTPWTLIVHLDDPSLNKLLTRGVRLYLGLALLLVLAIAALGVFQSRRYAGPALRLATFVETCEIQEQAAIPQVPRIWVPFFERVARIAGERRALLQRTQDHAEELERKVAERTTELQSANAALERNLEDLRQTQQELVRADRLGALGGLIAGVANELQVPLDQAARTARDFSAQLDAFKTQWTRGLRKAELETFIEQAEAVGRRVGQDIGASVELLSRFKQLAVDQASEQPRRFRLHEVAENVLAAMRPVLTWKDCRVDNRIPPGVETHAQAGVFGQILHHLLTDAIERADLQGQGARVELSAQPGNDERGEWILLTVADKAPAPERPQTGLTLATTLVRDTCRGDIERIDTASGAKVTARLPIASV